jgi:CBS domain-containing protein
MMAVVDGACAVPGKGASPMEARDIMTREVITTRPEATLGEAAAVMAERRISCLPVVDEGRLVGIVTETDIVRCIEREIPAAGAARPLGSRILWSTGTDYLDAVGQLRVSAAMSRQVIAVRPDDSVEHVAETLARHRIRRVPVLMWDAVVGIVSQTDLVVLLAGDSSPLTQPEWLGWCFLPATGFVPHAAHVAAAPGVTVQVDPDRTPFTEAPAAYRDITLALRDADGLLACRVKLGGEMVERGGRTAATRWQCVWTADASGAVVDWAAEAVERTLLREEELGQRIDPRAWEAIRIVRRCAAEREGDTGVPSLREVEAARAADLKLPPRAGGAFDAMLEAASSCLAAREPGRNAGASRVWQSQVARAAADAVHQATALLPPGDADEVRGRLAAMVLDLAPLGAEVR